MNPRGRARVSGQASAQSVPRASGPTHIGNSVAPQMTVKPRTMDAEHIAARKPMAEMIFQLIQKNTSSDWDGKLPEIVNGLEEHIFRTASKLTYMTLLRDGRALNSALKTMIDNNQLARFASLSTHGMMIPTSGMTKSYAESVISGGMEISNMIAVDAAAVAQTTATMGNFPPSMNSLADNGSEASDGSTSNGHKYQTTNLGLSGSSNLVSSLDRSNVPKLIQMVPTPGFAKPQSSVNSESSTGASFSNRVYKGSNATPAKEKYWKSEQPSSVQFGGPR